jgi:pimeloyl-ACP methyl ester carboxylesterase
MIRSSHRFVVALICLIALQSADYSAAADWPGKASEWKGFARYDFMVDGRRSHVVIPKKAAANRPWVWRARFFGHEPQADLALLAKGYHIAYCDVGGLFGSPKAVGHWNKFYELLTQKHGLHKRPALEGMSRGGLIVYNWAAANPQRVACLYGDAPVCDFKSWPLGQGAGKGSPGTWKACLAAYGLTHEEALEYRKNPVDHLKPLADAKIPILHVVGDADKVVPVSENSALIESRYKALGGEIKVISKKGIGHHPHALKDPQPIVDFILKHTR